MSLYALHFDVAHQEVECERSVGLHGFNCLTEGIVLGESVLTMIHNIVIGTLTRFSKPVSPTFSPV